MNIVIIGGGLAARHRGRRAPQPGLQRRHHRARRPSRTCPTSGLRSPRASCSARRRGRDPAVVVHDADWYADHEVDLRHRHPGHRHRPRPRPRRDRRRRADRYDRLLLATGASPRRLPLAEPRPARTSSYLRTLDDAARAQGHLAQPDGGS